MHAWVARFLLKDFQAFLEAVVQRCSVKKVVLRNFAKVTGKRQYQSLFFNKACNFIKKETLAQVFSCEFCEISRNTFLHRTLLVAASAFLSLAQSMLIFLSFRSLLFRPNQHLSNKSIKQTINSWRIVLIGYWRIVQHIMTWLQRR